MSNEIALLKHEEGLSRPLDPSHPTTEALQANRLFKIETTVIEGPAHNDTDNPIRF